MNTRESFSPENTFEIAKEIAEQFGHSLILLKGPMGSGKTLFSKGFAAGLGIEQKVSSPTYTIMNEYRTDDHCLYHLDLYRINSLEEVIDTGLYEILESEIPCLVEWPERVEDLNKLPHLQVNFSLDLAKSPDYRKITWEWIGS
ncbi:MAG: tRNA threonylcarbamoyladenosine biosynthesis protein TsaE [Clostridiales bacterium]|jgi:tRNA threonylcarbamoyladenosine biosynthesis protein TsaE|nr:tRNA threonylcarbamoyladenosine biosynthesis protein TsaE [Clostridiales bacterium]MDN5283358.1 tRNA threonylcarbamoyladenosine biosynthesis protein TsaE [Candidatus Ozemobacter sp.]